MAGTWATKEKKRGVVQSGSMTAKAPEEVLRRVGKWPEEAQPQFERRLQITEARIAAWPHSAHEVSMRRGRARSQERQLQKGFGHAFVPRTELGLARRGR